MQFSLDLPDILTIIFVICKILGYITWSWWWVFAPLWISFPVALITILILLITAIAVGK